MDDGGPLKMVCAADVKPLPRRVHIEDDCVRLTTAIPSQPYYVEIRALNTPLKILHWVEHLSNKTWMTPQAIREFVIIACKEHGFDLFGCS